MQVMICVYDDKYEVFGGIFVVFDLVMNVCVGVQVLKECIQWVGGIEEGLCYYVGVVNLMDDVGYVFCVLVEVEQMKVVVVGCSVFLLQQQFCMVCELVMLLVVVVDECVVMLYDVC